MKLILERFKSVTYWYGILIMFIPYLYENIHLLKDVVGENYQVASFVMGFILLLIRERTSIPLSEKIKEEKR